MIAVEGVARDAVRRLLRPGALLITLALLIAAVLTVMHDHNWPSHEAWHPEKSHAESLWSGVWGGSSIVALIGGVLVGGGYTRMLGRSNQDDDLRDLCRAIWVVCVRLKIPFDAIGVNIWTSRGFYGGRYLERRASFMPKARTETPIIWHRGKGAIGSCWERDAAFIVDTEEIERRAGDEQSYRTLDRQFHFGLSWNEFQHVRRYRAILVAPIRVRRPGWFTVKGVLAVDVSVDGMADKLARLSKNDDFVAAYTLAASVLGGKRTRA